MFFLATYPATKLDTSRVRLLNLRALMSIAHIFWLISSSDDLLSSEVWVDIVASKSQFDLNKAWIFNIFSELFTSFKATKKRSPDIWRCRLNRRCIGYDWNFVVQRNSNEPELSWSSIKDARHRNDWIMAYEVCFESWNFLQLGFAEHFHSASQLVNARRNWGFWSFGTAAFLSLLWW